MPEMSRFLGIIIRMPSLYQDALLIDWQKAENRETLDSIPPLE
jgi:hypothetical protein